MQTRQNKRNDFYDTLGIVVTIKRKAAQNFSNSFLITNHINMDDKARSEVIRQRLNAKLASRTVSTSTADNFVRHLHSFKYTFLKETDRSANFFPIDDDDDDVPPPLIPRADATESDDDNDDSVPDPAPSATVANTLTVTISAAPTNDSATYFATGSVPDFDPSPSARVNRHVNVIVHNIVNGRVDVASDLYIKYNDTFSDEAKQIIFQHVRKNVDEEFGLDKEMVPICFPGYFDVWWNNGGDVPPPMETPKTQDDGGGKPRANDPMVWETSEMKEAPDRACFTDFSSIERRQSHFQDEDSF